MSDLTSRILTTLLLGAFALGGLAPTAGAAPQRITREAAAEALCVAVSEEAKSSSSAAVFETGRASWYGGSFIGGKTASGERYRAGDCTAAHRTLPFGTYVRVINLRNNKSTIVRINNRGPHIAGRVIDLSKKAATDLSMLQAGTVKVRVEVVSKELALLELAALQ